MVVRGKLSLQLFDCLTLLFVLSFKFRHFSLQLYVRLALILRCCWRWWLCAILVIRGSLRSQVHVANVFNLREAKFQGVRCMTFLAELTSTALSADSLLLDWGLLLSSWRVLAHLERLASHKTSSALIPHNLPTLGDLKHFSMQRRLLVLRNIHPCLRLPAPCHLLVNVVCLDLTIQISQVLRLSVSIPAPFRWVWSHSSMWRRLLSHWHSCHLSVITAFMTEFLLVLEDLLVMGTLSKGHNIAFTRAMPGVCWLLPRVKDGLHLVRRRSRYDNKIFFLWRCLWYLLTSEHALTGISTNLGITFWSWSTVALCDLTLDWTDQASSQCFQVLCLSIQEVATLVLSWNRLRKYVIIVVHDRLLWPSSQIERVPTELVLCSLGPFISICLQKMVCSDNTFSTVA